MIRLSDNEIKAIIDTALEVFGEGARVWIFGSRTDMNKKGGDIDIYIEIENFNIEDVVRKKLDFLIKLDDKIGEQKIDVLISPHDSKERHSIEAKNTGIRIL